MVLGFFQIFLHMAEFPLVKLFCLLFMFIAWAYPGAGWKPQSTVSLSSFWFASTGPITLTPPSPRVDESKRSLVGNFVCFLGAATVRAFDWSPECAISSLISEKRFRVTAPEARSLSFRLLGWGDWDSQAKVTHHHLQERTRGALCHCCGFWRVSFHASLMVRGYLSP